MRFVQQRRLGAKRADQLALRVAVPIARGFVGAPVIAAAPRKRVQRLLENRPDGGADILVQTIFDRIMARFTGQQRKRGSVGIGLRGVISLAVAAAGWVGSSHPEITPPSNFHHLRDTPETRTTTATPNALEFADLDTVCGTPPLVTKDCRRKFQSVARQRPESQGQPPGSFAIPQNAATRRKNPTGR